MRDALAGQPPPPQVLVWLIALLTLAVAPHLWHLGAVAPLVFLLAAAWRLWLLRRGARLPGPLLLGLLLVLALALVWLQYGVGDIRRSGVSLLVVMLGLKLLEVRSRRDLYMTSFLGYFVVVTQFLFDQGLGVSLYLAPVVAGLTAVLLALNRATAPRQPLAVVAETGRMLAAALPGMLLLFLLFPRLNAPLWQLGLDSSQGITGLSDTLRPGSISALSQSAALAFRVDFAGTAPPPEQRYWRGLVLWSTDGQTWRTVERRAGPVPALLTEPPGIDYEVTLEPTSQPWLFTLDRTPAARVPEAALDADLTLRAERPVQQRLSYTLTAFPDAWWPELTAADERLGLQLPANVTPRMRALVATWQAEAGSDRALLARALAYFREQPFVYTLEPPLVRDNPADQFLFETRQGFCEHYATSFVLLMRLAGIPARVVVGYQGGEINPRGGHLMVRQAEAHAWAEVWLEGEGWTRTDPTAAVAPERVRLPIDAANSAAGAPVAFRIDAPGPLRTLLLEGRWLMDAVDLNWHRWVVGFDQERQAWLLRAAGLGFLQGYALALAAVLAAGLGATLGAVLWRLRGGRRGRPDPTLAAYQRLQAKLQRAGLAIPPWWGPRELQHAAAARFPAQASELGELLDAYVALRYGADPNALRGRQFRRAVRRFRPRAER